MSRYPPNITLPRPIEENPNLEAGDLISRRLRTVSEWLDHAKSSMDSSEISGRIREAVLGLGLRRRISDTGLQQLSDNSLLFESQLNLADNGSEARELLSDGEYELVPSRSTERALGSNPSDGYGTLNPRAAEFDPTSKNGLVSIFRPPEIPPFSFQAESLNNTSFLETEHPSAAENGAVPTQPISQGSNGSRRPVLLRGRQYRRIRSASGQELSSAYQSANWCDRPQSERPSPTRLINLYGGVSWNRLPRSTSFHSGKNAPVTEIKSIQSGLSKPEVVIGYQDGSSERALVSEPQNLLYSYLRPSNADQVITNDTISSDQHLESGSVTTVCPAIPSSSQSLFWQANEDLSQSSSVHSLTSSVNGGIRIQDHIAKGIGTRLDRCEEAAPDLTDPAQEAAGQQKMSDVDSWRNTVDPSPRLPNFESCDINRDGSTKIGGCSMCGHSMFEVQFSLYALPKPSFPWPNEIAESIGGEGDFVELALNQGRGLVSWTGGQVVHHGDPVIVSCGRCSNVWHRYCMQSRLARIRGYGTGASCPSCGELWEWATGSQSYHELWNFCS